MENIPYAEETWLAARTLKWLKWHTWCHGSLLQVFCILISSILIAQAWASFGNAKWSQCIFSSTRELTSVMPSVFRRLKSATDQPEGKTQLDTWPKRGTGHLPTQVTSIAESHWRSPSFRWTELEFGMCVFLAILNVSNLNIKLSWIDKLKINPGTSNRFRWNSMDTDWPTKVTPHGPFF